MGRIENIYWKNRSIINFIISLTISYLSTENSKFGIPNIFVINLESFQKASELMLTVGSSLLGFTISAVTLIYTLTSGQRFDILRKSKAYPDLGRASRAAMFWLLVASVAGLLFLFISPLAYTSAVSALTTALAFTVTQAVLSAAALTWVIGKLLTLA